MARYLVLTGYDDNMKEVGDRCSATHEAYAIHHGYDHEVVREYLPTTHPSHQKIRLLRRGVRVRHSLSWHHAARPARRTAHTQYLRPMTILHVAMGMPEFDRACVYLGKKQAAPYFLDTAQIV